MQKTKINIKPNIIAYTDAYKVAQLSANNWYNNTSKIANSNGEAEIDFTNIELIEFGIQVVMFLINNIRETRCR